MDILTVRIGEIEFCQEYKYLGVFFLALAEQTTKK